MSTLHALARLARTVAIGLAWATLSLPALATEAATGLDNATCLGCHGAQAAKIEVPGPGGKPRALRGYGAEGYAQGVHGRMGCVDCHTGITDRPAAGAAHVKSDPAAARSATCADCHQSLWDAAKGDPAAQQARPRLGDVARNIGNYRESFHARPHKNDPARALATCTDCHDTHTFNVPPQDSPARAAWKLSTPQVCGTSCHGDALDEYKESVHGQAALGKKDDKAAVCIDCHTSHSVGNTSAAPIKLAITAQCGSCHTDEYKSYKATYHGQVSTLGWANTAKCYDCHGSHGILAVKDEASKVHAANRLETCQSCHGKKGVSEASAGFVSFQPHARTDDYARYPQVWLGYRMMVGLLVGTFAFFWLHTALWFWRELQDRRQAVPRPHVQLDGLPAAQQGLHFRRFSATWRVAHIVFALSLMVLTVTGMPLFYPDAAWAPWVMQALGGPKVAGMIHRVCAVIFAAVFFWHLGYIALRLWRQRHTFRWFGPDSLIPNLQDMKDMVAMFRWFFGRGPRPVFERWTYWEKFDYWAPFWGVTIIGVSGLLMWLPTLTATWLPGWVFNVAAIFHGEEAFLAVVFLFTVHFFNNHFRPDKFPVEVVMFTGTMPLEHYRREHRLEYERLVASGELERRLVDAPSAPMTTASKLLGYLLIAVGLTLLFGVAIGFFSGGG